MRRLLLSAVILILQCSISYLFAQVTIGGNVYGGGNAGDTNGSATVTIYGGEITGTTLSDGTVKDGCVFGGACQANVDGHTFVHIDGQHMSHDIIIRAVYGGNDIAGKVGKEGVTIDASSIISQLSKEWDSGETKVINNTYNTFVRTTAERTTDYKIFIGQLFGAGNGDYPDNYYTTAGLGLVKPELARTYLEILGGTFGYVYSGGNKATVTHNADIYINNKSTAITARTDEQLTAMGINTIYYDPTFQFSRVFGGNNKADMAIRPTWHLERGSIENLYSGGNEGRMISTEGLLLEIDPHGTDAEKMGLKIENVYGGCRKADVFPSVDGINLVSRVVSPVGYKFPPDLAARVLVRGGDIGNVYGGNDVKGKVAFGNAVGIYTSIRGNVYGGGNGDYPYTDNPVLANDLKYGDFYYDPGTNSVEALNSIRPHAEQVSIRVVGKTITNAAGEITQVNPTIIRGSIYLGGNSATLKNTQSNPMVELKIGSYVIADKVFLGNNGANMVKNQNDDDILKLYKSINKTSNGSRYTSLDLTDKATFAKYMDGCALDLMPSVVFDDEEKGDPATYIDYTSYFGSLYCGGNVGSMTKPDLTTMDFKQKLVIFDKVVGGCNNAYVAEKTGVNAEYSGGIIGATNERGEGAYVKDGLIKNRLVLNFNGLKIQPKRWNTDPVAVPYAIGDFPKELVWNTIDKDGSPTPPVLTGTGNASTADLERRFTGGSIYGGCYNSGVINGNVVINMNNSIIDRSKLFDEVESDELGEEVSLYGSDQTTETTYNITERHTGVILGQQGMDVLGHALNVYGGGKGPGTEIWGSTTINLNAGYTFQVFGGSEEGVIGRPVSNGDHSFTYILKDGDGNVIEDNNGDPITVSKTYTYDPKYSCYVNLCGEKEGVSKKEDSSEAMAECEFMYGGGFFGPIAGNTVINLGKGRIFNSFAGSCNADILGHTETYIGRQVKEGDTKETKYEYKNNFGKYITAESTYMQGFPWIRDIVYGGNDLGGEIKGEVNFENRVRSDVRSMVHLNDADHDNSPDVLKASAYTEYLQGRADAIFGGCYGTYDYKETRFSEYFNADGSAKEGYSKPRMNNAFINFRPTYENAKNVVKKVYGAGQGYSGETDRDLMQNRSYVLIDIPQSYEKKYENLEVFGAGAWGGVGMGISETDYNADKDKGSAIIDLLCGEIGAAYGASYKEGVTRRTVVNVPQGSTIKIGSIFGGAYGTETLLPCDVYEANVEYHSADAVLKCNPRRTETDAQGQEITVGNVLQKGAIYGGNNQERRTIYGKINIDVPVWQDHYKYNMTKATVYGAGYGERTWSEYTEINLDKNAEVFEVYGGGEAGRVLNAESVQAYMNDYQSAQGATDEQWAAAWKLGGGLDPASPTGYVSNAKTNLENSLVREAEMDDRETKTYKYNTNVIIHRGAYVGNYAYGGGLGKAGVDGSGDVYGTTYIALLGGKVNKDLYAAGTRGGVYDAFKTENFIASANAYIEGGTARNVYGGGWEGSVGKHKKLVNKKDENGENVVENGQPVMIEVNADIDDPFTDDVLGETHVVIGRLEENIRTDSISDPDKREPFYYGRPAIERNAYAGGEGGAVFGTAHITMYNGFVGYRFFPTEPEDKTIDYIQMGGGYYQEKLHDETWSGDGTNRLYDSGSVYGGGYVDNSSVDVSYVTMYGGHVRNALFGGGEIAAIGRGIIDASGENNSIRTLRGIYKAGKTNVELYDGYVHRNVFGGGRGYNNVGDKGTLYSDGYVFGQTEVHIHGGEVGTAKELLKENGNVFGGGDIGYVYSAYEYDDNGTKKLGVGKQSGNRYDNGKEGYYYKNEGGAYVNGVYNGAFVEDEGEYVPTEDCKVLIEPHTKVISDGVVSFTGIHYAKEMIVSSIDLKYLKENNQTTGIDLSTGKVTADDGITFSRSYAKGEYVPVYALNTLKSKNDTQDKDTWKKLDPHGIIIHNAVFAGGNTSSGSVTEFANATSVFGNATASIHDAYHRDLITLGTGHTGGLYGDGNLTFVDGYRGLNITNYGTDYYSISREIDIDTYHALPEREAAYYELKYKCMKICTDKDGTRYTPKDPNNENSKASTITADDLLVLFMNDDGTPVQVNDQGERVTSGGTAVLEQINDKWVPKEEYWEENGVLPVYAGRLMNSIQRADFCGVFGSRMVMQGAPDRVPEIVDFTNYTINRVREVSLNQQHSIIPSDLTLKPDHENPEDYADIDKAIHGNYFGIYNIVNYLGALSSDVHFKDPDNGNEDTRKTSNTSPDYAADGKTYYQWKAEHIKDRKRNNGSSLNKVALASGVYLELTTEQSTGTDLNEKDWGYITGVIELDLINVQQGIGGGFVYAKNEHGKQTYHQNKHSTLTALNRDALTRKDFTYSTTELYEWETSGNFVHSTQTIIDDCYNISGKYSGNDAVPAHYWYIKGSVYVYDQYISAYTGAPNAYSESVDIPLTITAASHGTMKLLNVKPNKYAYYSNANSKTVIEDGKKVVINDVAYYKNDPISYWDWYLLSNSEKDLFVDETFVTIADCKIGETEYPAGTVLLPGKEDGSEPGTYYALKKANEKVYHVAKQENVDFDFVFRPSNNLSHDTGYILTYKVNNPTDWDTWYTKYTGAANAKSKTEYSEACNKGPTYHLNSSDGGVLGQRDYKVGDLISEEVYYTYEGKDGDADYPGIKDNIPDADKDGQAEFGSAYLVTEKITIPGENGSGTTHLNPGVAVSATVAESHSGSVSPAYICTSTVQLSKTEFILLNTKMTLQEKNKYIDDINKDIKALGITDADNPTQAEITALSAENKKKLASLQDIKNDIIVNIVPAYYCTKEGLYGGNYYESGHNYRGLYAWSSMSEADREKFTFNYDALDLLIDPDYTDLNTTKKEGSKYQYDGEDEDGIMFKTEDQAKTNLAGYSLTKPVDYTAEYNSDTNLALTSGITVKRNGNPVQNVTSVQKGDELSRDVFEGLANEQRHYAPIMPTADNLTSNIIYKVYVVNNPFQIGNTPYAVGQTISASDYNSLGNSSDANNVTVLEFTSADVGTTYYYCRESYEIASGGSPVKSIKGSNSSAYAAGQTVPVGAVIGATNTTDGTDVYIGFTNLANDQKNFTIHGIAPTETSTFYVSRESDIFDLSTEKIITVVYEYNYEESDQSGNITPISERHVVNIHITFKSGVPTIEDIKAPQIVIPGDLVSLREPFVTPGAYEVTGGGWELFENIDDAESHSNGVEYLPQSDPLYWYQHDWYVAYYAKTYLGKTYSNHVQVSVANYHDLKKVIEAEKHHYYVDIPDLTRLKRVPKIYINNYGSESKSAIDMLKDLFDLSLLDDTKVNTDEETGLITTVKGTDEDSPFKGHALLNKQVEGAKNLEFILQANIAYTDDPASDDWAQIGTDAECFEGTLHGDGHTISGLDHSLFKNLCGNVYNLGVTGSFTGGGIADKGDGYAENCWVNTMAGTLDANTKAIIGNPTRTDGTYQVVNCYYPEANAYAASAATPKSAKAFYNGEVAYDLNGFYLYKRYCDQKVSTGADNQKYQYYTVAADNTLTLQPAKYYATNNGFCSSGYNGLKYVEDRFADGDFIYSDGSIPETENERLYVNSETGDRSYYPIWPDDYLFFGQALNYGYMDGKNGRDLRTHQDLPTTINKSGDRITTTNEGNRVFRAPAYFRSKNMGVAHYNANAVFAAIQNKEKAEYADTIAYRTMTAIDFTGYNETGYDKGSVKTAPYDQIKNDAGTVTGGFYPPLLDDEGLQSIYVAKGITRNLLVYTGTATDNDEKTASEKTADVVMKYLPDEAYAETNPTYRTVKAWDSHSDNIYGHWVEKQTDNQGNVTYVAKNDHMLVDKQDFNCPIAYTLAAGKRMWYQRMPDNDKYVDIEWSDDNPPVRTTKGWDGISLPFAAEIVTTDEKGEITHFYSGSETSKNETGTKIGHEYWLREFTGIGKETEADVAKAVLTYPSPRTNETWEDKKYTNSFLWDYYYSFNSRDDRNGDKYPGDYYMSKEHSDGDYVQKYENYVPLRQATPYIIGFPGERYYEFDLSGTFEAATAKTVIPEQVDRQTITFASWPGADVGVSDDETNTGTSQTYNSKTYTFIPSYMKMELEAGTNSYTLSANGSSYDKVPAAGSEESPVAATPVEAFRPYFTVSGSSVRTRSIIFSEEDSQLKGKDDNGPKKDEIGGTLDIYAKRHKIIVESSLAYTVDVRIVNTAGITLNTFTIEPGETVETRVNTSGVYIVQPSEVKYTKKLAVR